MKRLTDNTFIRFGIVGVVNTIVGTAVMLILFNLFGCSYWLSSAANYVVGSIVSYFLNRSFTFHSQEKHFKAIIKFTLNIIVCYLIAYGVAKPAIGQLLSEYNSQVQGNVALVSGAVLFIVLNYVGQKLFVFNKQG